MNPNDKDDSYVKLVSADGMEVSETRKHKNSFIIPVKEGPILEYKISFIKSWHSFILNNN